MKSITTIGVLTLALLLSAAASAQPMQPTTPPPAPWAGPAGNKLRQKIARRIQLIRMSAIITALALNPKQAPKFFAVVNQFEVKLKKIRLSNHRIMAQLSQMVRSGKYAATKINTLAAQLMKNQIQIKQLELKRFQAVRKIITAQQLAKLLIALPRIERRIRRLIRRAQQRHRRGRGPNPPLVGP
jgi:Spy/CpxP family protein refolding chaperone